MEAFTTSQTGATTERSFSKKDRLWLQAHEHLRTLVNNLEKATRGKHPAQSLAREVAKLSQLHTLHPSVRELVEQAKDSYIRILKNTQTFVEKRGYNSYQIFADLSANVPQEEVEVRIGRTLHVICHGDIDFARLYYLKKDPRASKQILNPEALNRIANIAGFCSNIGADHELGHLITVSRGNLPPSEQENTMRHEEAHALYSFFMTFFYEHDRNKGAYHFDKSRLRSHLNFQPEKTNIKQRVSMRSLLFRRDIYEQNIVNLIKDEILARLHAGDTNISIREALVQSDFYMNRFSPKVDFFTKNFPTYTDRLPASRRRYIMRMHREPPPHIMDMHTARQAYVEEMRNFARAGMYAVDLLYQNKFSSQEIWQRLFSYTLEEWPAIARKLVRLSKNAPSA